MMVTSRAQNLPGERFDWHREASFRRFSKASSAARSSRRCSPFATSRPRWTSCRTRCCASPRSTAIAPRRNCQCCSTASCRTRSATITVARRYGRCGRRSFLRSLPAAARTKITIRWKLTNRPRTGRWRHRPGPVSNKAKFLKSLSKSWPSYLRVNGRLSSCVTGRNWTSLRRRESWDARRAV